MSNDIWSMVLLLGLFGWITSTLLLIIKAFPSREEFLGRQAVTWGGCVVVSFIVWIVGLLNA